MAVGTEKEIEEIFMKVSIGGMKEMSVEAGRDTSAEKASA
jgi:hypothetical protein